MKHVLFVDFISPQGHILFNNIYLCALNTIGGVNLDLFLSEEFKDKLALPKDIINRVIYYRKPSVKIVYTKRLGFHYSQFLIQRQVSRLVKENNYDIIIVSSFDNISIPFFKTFSKPTFAVVHNNIDQCFDHKVESVFLKAASKKLSFIALNKAAEQYLKSRFEKVLYVPHGIPILSKIDSQDLGEERMFFSPINEMLDPDVMKKVLTQEFNSFLSHIDSKLIIKYKGEVNSHYTNVSIERGFIEQKKFDFIFRKAKVIFLPYDPIQYLYRSSALLMMAISYNKRVVLPVNENFLQYNEPGDNGLYYYSSDNELEEVMEKSMNDNREVCYCKVKGKQSYNTIGEFLESMVYG